MSGQELEQEFRLLAVAERRAVAARTKANDVRRYADAALEMSVECPNYAADLERARALDVEADGAQTEARAIRARIAAALADATDPQGMISAQLREMHRTLNAEEADAETARREAESKEGFRQRSAIGNARAAARKVGMVRP